jgi:hypothetical protein
VDLEYASLRHGKMVHRVVVGWIWLRGRRPRLELGWRPTDGCGELTRYPVLTTVLRILSHVAFGSLQDHDPVVTFDARPAAFGMHVSSEPGLLGYLIPLSSFTESCNKSQVDDIDMPQLWDDQHNSGCPVLCFPDEPPNRPPNKNESWIALVQRGDCPFVEKVREGMRLGARAVIVGGSKPDSDGGSIGKDELVTMYSVG